MSLPNVTRSTARAALRAATKQVAQKQAVRGFAVAAAARPALRAAVGPAPLMQKRGVKTIDFAGTEEKVRS